MSGRSSEARGKRGQSGNGKRPTNDFLGFIDIQLSEADKASLDRAHFESEDAFSFIEEMLEDGYKISISSDPAHKSVIVTATGRNSDDPNYGYALSGRGADVVGGLASLAYKHITLCERGSWSNFAGHTEPSKWG
jgi:hypothetical protein